MPLARIIASKPAAARETAKALRQSGYEVEIVMPGWRSDSPADLEYNLDTDTVISQPEETFVLGEREFFLVPLWRNWMARLHSSRDVARAQKAATARLAANALPLVNSTLSFAGHHSPEDESAREEDAMTRQRELREREAELATQAGVAQKREQEAHLRQQSLLREQKEAEDRKQEALLLQRQEEAREQEAARQQLILRQREEERQREALRLRQEELRRQEETRQRDLVRRQQEELRQQEIIRQHQLLRQQEELRRQEAVRRQQQELMQYETLKAEREAALARNDTEKDATPFIPETVVSSGLTGAAAETNAPVVTVVSPGEFPPLREYISQRWNHWRNARRASSPEESKSFAWKQAWPVAAGVAVAFLLGWAASSYDGQAQPVAHATAPITTVPVKYAPYPVQKSRQRLLTSANQHRAVATKRAQTIRRGPLQDEVVIRKYPSNATTAQNKPMPHRKRISDLE